MKRAIIPIIIVAVVAGGGFILKSKLRADRPAEKTQFKVARAELGTVKKTVSATGTLQPWRTVDIKSKAGGRVDQMVVDVGSVVKRGQLLAKIDPSDTQLQVDQAKADIETALARENSSSLTKSLTQKQSELAVQTAAATLASSRASLRAAEARLETAHKQMLVQPELTRAIIESARQNLESAEKQLAEMREATQPQERASAQSALAQAKANERNAKANLSRQETLMKKGFVSEQVVDSARANAEVMSAQVTAAQSKLDTIDNEQRAAAASMGARAAQARAQYENAKAAGIDVDIRKTAHDEARANVEQLKHQVENSGKSLELAKANLANVAIRETDIASARASKARAQAGLTNAMITYNQTQVTAPSDGVVLKKYVEQGTIISSALSFAATGNNIIQLGDTTRMYIDVTVDETDIANVDDGQAVDVTIEAYPGVPFEGKVSRIDPQAEVVQNVTMVHVRVEIDNSAPSFRLLKPGMNSTCEFVISKKQDVVSAPAEAVHTDDKGRYVEIARGGAPYKSPDGKGEAEPNTLVDVKIERRPVEVGLEGNDNVEITAGVKDGETLVTQTIEPAPTQAGSPFQQRMGGFGNRNRR